MKKVSLLIVLLAIMIGCSKEEKPTEKQKPIERLENSPLVVKEEPKTTNIKTDPEKWFNEKIYKESNKIIRYTDADYSPQVAVIEVKIKDGIFDLHYAFDVEAVDFPSRYPPKPPFHHYKVSPGVAYIAEAELILSLIYEMSKEIEIKTVKIRSTAVLQSKNQWGEKSEKEIIMFKALYNKSNLERIFKAFDNSEPINIRKNAASFYGRMRNPAE